MTKIELLLFSEKNRIGKRVGEFYEEVAAIHAKPFSKANRHRIARFVKGTTITPTPIAVTMLQIANEKWNGKFTNVSELFEQAK